MSKEKTKYAAVGGQALLDGIMMQAPAGAAIAVRNKDGRIIVEQKEIKHAKDKFKPLGFPVIRGVVNFVESMVFGYGCMMESTDLSGMMELDEVEEENQGKVDKWLTDHFGPALMSVVGAIGMVLGLLLAFGLFLYLPAFLVDMIAKAEVLQKFHPFFEGIIRIVIFVAYMLLVSLQSDIKKTFMYHGAEHKSIFCYEAKKPLTVENIKPMKRFHPRCGTSFIFVILILSILISSVLTLIFPKIDDVRIVWVGIKLLICPVVMGLGYEFIRYAGKHDNIFTKICSAPGLWMQRITTKEPTDDIIEVGITALTAALYGAESDEVKALPYTVITAEAWRAEQETAKESKKDNSEDDGKESD